MSPSPASPRDSLVEGYGGFTLGGMQLALPMAALREVLPCGPLIDLPCPAACVIGGIDLRGVLVPVVDLRRLLGREAPPCASPCVVLMVDDGRILGLLAEGVSGVFPGIEGTLHRVQVDDPTAAVFAGSIQRNDDRSLVNVLEPRALARLPQVPMVDDPEPARQQRVADSTEVVIDDQFVPVMLFRCGRVPLAIDAMSVHATVSDPKIRPSVLARGDCLGVIDYAGSHIPVLDLITFFGLGPCTGQAGAQAFVVRFDTGLLAFLVDEVVDVVRILPDRVMKVPAYALPQPRLFAGALPTTALPEGRVERDGVAVSQYLLIDGPALRQCAELVSLASISTASSSADVRSFVPGVQQATGQRAMVTYALGGETATPLEQVKEILPYVPELAIFELRGALLGLLAHRGRSIPVMCLSRLLGLAPPEVCSAVSVLVVEADEVLTGFAVPSLRTIEPADWEPGLPRMGLHQHDELTQALQTRQLVQVGSSETRRMLRMLDLERIARALQAQAA